MMKGVIGRFNYIWLVNPGDVSFSFIDSTAHDQNSTRSSKLSKTLLSKPLQTHLKASSGAPDLQC